MCTSKNYFSLGLVAGQLTAAPPTCPCDTFIFRCNVTGGVTTTWTVDGGSKVCSLSHLSTNSDMCGPNTANDTFTARPETGFGQGTTATSFIPTLSATATPALNGTLVECFGPSTTQLVPEERVGNGTIQIIGQ